MAPLAPFSGRSNSLLENGYWQVAFVRDEDILPPYPKGNSSIVDTTVVFSDAYSSIVGYQGPPYYTHYSHETPGTISQCGPLGAWSTMNYCGKRDPDGNLIRTAFSDDQGTGGITAGCVTQSRSSIVYQLAVWNSILYVPDECGETMTHEALHLLDLNVPIDPQTGLSVTCLEGYILPTICTEEARPPWCSDHSPDVEWSGDPPPGMPAAVAKDGLMTVAPDEPLSVRSSTCLKTNDPSNGQSGLSGAIKHALRQHSGLEDGQ